ncbi:MAG: ribonuclease HII [Clostridia bacterium]|nr:ribonuclease HII [Clostridia bacterium]
MQTNTEFDRQFRTDDTFLLCGVDEAGRGPFAGPVCAAAVILPADVEIEGLNDSKKLTEKKREKLFPIICEKALAYHIAFASVEEIEEHNILQATFMAMRRAVEGLSLTPNLVLVDGDKLPAGLPVPAQTLIKGDALSASVAAASVLAKVSRDRLMIELDKEYPQYGFAAHKGYGTAAHCAAILEHGVLPCHRRSFLKKLLAKEAR